MKVVKPWFCLMWLLLLPWGCSRPIMREPLQTHPVPSARWPNSLERGAYQVRLANQAEALWKVNWETRVSRLGGQVQVDIQEQGQGKTWGASEPTVWRKQMSLQVSPGVKLYQLEGSRWAYAGNLLSRLKIQPDAQQHQIFYRDTQESGDQKEGKVPWIEGAIPKEFLFHWTRTLSFDQIPAGECLLMVSPNRSFRMSARVEATEEVVTPAGTFWCHRIRFSPNLGMLKFLPVKAWIPKMVLWCTQQEPHYWVRYQGPIGGPGSPDAIIELTRMETIELPVL